MMKLKTKYIICRNLSIFLSMLCAGLITFIILDYDETVGSKLKHMNANKIQMSETEDEITLQSEDTKIIIRKVK